MGYLSRYLRGEYEAVWSELIEMGPAVRDSSVFSDALAVARETMGRVAANVDEISSRLLQFGYDFEFYPNGLAIPFCFGPRLLPSEALLRDVSELEGLVGVIPVSIKTFWEMVGAVSFIGKFPQGWLEYSDPLVVEPPEVSLFEYRERTVGGGQERSSAAFCAPLSPDVFHKEGVGGGPPYGLVLPSECMDGVIINETKNLHFIKYLRFSILECGGFAGVVSQKVRPGSSKNIGDACDIVLQVRNGLIPF